MSKLEYYIGLAKNGTPKDVDLLMAGLKRSMSFADSRFLDYALGLVTSTEGVERIKQYLFKGTQIQRNYSTLFFNRRSEPGDWEIVKKAYQAGLIDETQAFSK